ncbi:GNAT family N-acetyltransferase [Flagellimonas myxillae]|uniref:GNAT family N-acetyltransferase n=1 Tax=Flagellimonas myxillae TaxID=2942214 RepID=UPI00201F7C1C|nr:GNAT family N-acetyltransferase [Muricauda myxillae]MCL6265229.1 GNAT family N-acetyltransferase [Muricauda myxillae]
MAQNVTLEPVTQENLDTYISVGKQSYHEHYLHLWENRDPGPYISRSFTTAVVQKGLENSNLKHFLVKSEDSIAGIVKLVLDSPLDELSGAEALLAEKIYLLEAFSGKGIGKQVLWLIESYAKNLGKNIVWLDTMQKGGPIQFYLKNGFQIKRECELTLPHAIPSEKAMWVLTKQL